MLILSTIHCSLFTSECAITFGVIGFSFGVSRISFGVPIVPDFECKDTNPLNIAVRFCPH